MAGKSGTAEARTLPLTIRPELEHLAVPIGSVTPWPGNPRQGDQEKIRQSLLDHGQFAAVLVQASSGHVVKGNNTLAAMIALGSPVIAAHRLDLTDEQARQILAVDNRSSDDATYDQPALAALLAGMDSLDGTGWNPNELDELLRASDHLANQATAFLDDVMTPSPFAPVAAAPADPVAAAAAPQPAEVTQTFTPPPAVLGDPPPAAVEYVTMSWTCLADQRDTVRAAVRRAQQSAGLATAAEGLVAMSQHYLAATGGEA